MFLKELPTFLKIRFNWLMIFLCVCFEPLRKCCRLLYGLMYWYGLHVTNWRRWNGRDIQPILTKQQLYDLQTFMIRCRFCLSWEASLRCRELDMTCISFGRLATRISPFDHKLSVKLNLQISVYVIISFHTMKTAPNFSMRWKLHLAWCHREGAVFWRTGSADHNFVSRKKRSYTMLKCVLLTKAI